MLRQFVFNGVSTGEDIAKPFAEFDPHLAATHKLFVTIVEGPTLGQIDASPHPRTLLTELHLNAWFCTERVVDFAETGIGTKPGNPFGDLLSNFPSASILHVIHQRLQSEGIGSSVQTNVCRMPMRVHRSSLLKDVSRPPWPLCTISFLIAPASSHRMFVAVASAAA